jgi:methionyl-tRNA formyltransferase
MKVLFMGRKPAASTALRHLVDVGIEVVAVVAPLHPSESATATFWRPLLRDTAQELGIPVVDDRTIYEALSSSDRMLPSGQRLGDVDLVLSFLFWKKIEKPLIALPRIGCFNFHPGPLPDFRGRRGYNFAILENHHEYGASIHWVSERFDEGDLVEVRRFPSAPHETAFSLEQRTMRVLVEMFVDFIARAKSGKPIGRQPQGKGQSATLEEMRAAMRIDLSDSPQLTERRVRAFWYPPHHGAYIEIGGKRFTLVDDETLNLLGRFLHNSRETPY